jgi:hypothetical protein
LQRALFVFLVRGNPLKSISPFKKDFRACGERFAMPDGLTAKALQGLKPSP